jgi:DNA-binding beta-propeller fold protein YncE
MRLRLGVTYYLIGYLCVMTLLVGCTATPMPPTPTPAPRAPIVLANVPVKGYDVPVETAINRRTNLAYLTLSNHVAVFKDTELVADIKTGQVWGSELAIDETNDLVYVVNEFSDSVSVIRGTQLVTNVTTIGNGPRDVAIDSQGRLAYVVSAYQKLPNGKRGNAEGNILVLNGAQVVTNLTLARESFMRVVADANGYVYAATIFGTIVVLKDLKEVARFEGVPAGVYTTDRTVLLDMTVSLNTREVYILDSGNNVRKFKDGQLLEQHKMTGELASYYERIRIHPLTKQFYLLSKKRKEVVIIDNWQEVGRVPVSEYATRLEIDPLTGNAYVVNVYDGSITVMNSTQALGTIKTGHIPGSIGINPNNGMVYVMNTADQTVTILGYPPPNFTPPAPPKAPTAPLAPTRAPTPQSYP